MFSSSVLKVGFSSGLHLFTSNLFRCSFYGLRIKLPSVNLAKKWQIGLSLGLKNHVPNIFTPTNENTKIPVCTYVHLRVNLI